MRISSGPSCRKLKPRWTSSRPAEGSPGSPRTSSPAPSRTQTASFSGDQLDDLPAAAPGAAGAAAGGDAVREATDALRALGYKPAEVSRMIRDAAEADMSAEDIIRKALREAAA